MDGWVSWVWSRLCSSGVVNTVTWVWGVVQIFIWVCRTGMCRLISRMPMCMGGFIWFMGGSPREIFWWWGGSLGRFGGCGWRYLYLLVVVGVFVRGVVLLVGRWCSV